MRHLTIPATDPWQNAIAADGVAPRLALAARQAIVALAIAAHVVVAGAWISATIGVGAVAGTGRLAEPATVIEAPAAPVAAPQPGEPRIDPYPTAGIR
jgi:hypothetical protein